MMIGLLGLLGATGIGYLKKKQLDEADRQHERQDKLDEITFARADREKKAADREDSIRSGIAGAAKNEEVNNDAQLVTGIAAKPAVYENKDLASSDMREANRMLRAAPAPISAQGIIPQQDAAPVVASANAIGSPVPQQEPIAAQGVSMAAVGKPMFQGKEYVDAATAQAAADGYNSPDSRNARIAQVYRANGDHLGAMDLEAKAKQGQAADFTMKVAQHDYAKKLKDEGVFDAAAAMRRGDAAGVKSAFNAGGQYKIDGDVSIEPVEKDIPGIGKKLTYQATFNATGPDGQSKQVSYNSHDLGMQLMPAEKALDWDHTIFQDKTRQDQWKKEFDQKKSTDAAHIGIASRGMALQEGKDKREADQFKKQSPKGQVDLLEEAFGAKFSSEERKSLTLKIAGLGTDPSSHQKFAEGLATEAVKAGTMKMEDAPAKILEITNAFKTAANNGSVLQAAKSDLAGAKDDAAYASSYAESLKYGLTADQLSKEGFKPPKSATKEPIGSAQGATGQKKVYMTTVEKEAKLNADVKANQDRVQRSEIAKSDPEWLRLNNEMKAAAAAHDLPTARSLQKQRDAIAQKIIAQ
jgi:hypothetical protein